MKANPIYLVPQNLEPGWYQDVPEEVYHSWRLASNSGLTTIFNSSPAHLRYQLDHPKKSTPSMILGSATHLAILQPDLFDGRYYSQPEGDGRTKEVKIAREDAAAANPGKIGLAANEYLSCRKMASRVWENLDARLILESAGQIEVSALWNDLSHSVLCKARMDKVSEEFGATVDIKTCESAHPLKFERDIYNMGYHRQGAMYLNGARTLGLDVGEHYIIAVEKNPPYESVVYQLKDDALRLGNLQLDKLMRVFKECQEKDVWPGYPEGLVKIGVPAWAYKELE